MNFIRPLVHTLQTCVCEREILFRENTQMGCKYECMEIYILRQSVERKSEFEGRRRSGARRVWGRGVNFDMSFLKLSFDNWQFVQLVKCQESKKIDEVHNRCLRLTRRCGLESHARIRPQKRYRNEISRTCTHTNRHAHTRLLKSTSDMKKWSTSIYLG